jgi:hypothetical protein
MPAENTKERDFTGNCTLPAVWPFLLVSGFSAVPYHASGGLYNRVFLPEQLHVIQIESCHCFFLNVKGRFALPIRDWQASVIKVPFTTQALGPDNH